MQANVRRERQRLVLPGIATAHSHAFQRAMRARTQRRATEAGSFWTWRGLMYELAGKLDPESIHAVSRFAFVELARAGFTAVGEFHYVHHQPDGTPYDDRTVMADAVIRAAREVGLRITLLRTLYQRGGPGVAAEPGQRRFCDASVDRALADVETLATRYRDDPLVRVGVAPHSVRAVERSWIQEASRFSRGRGMALHMHVSEQRREIDECVSEHGLRPVAMLAEDAVLDSRFVAVHATHLDESEARELGRAGAFACICRTTERDLGDGVSNSGALVRAGVRLCTGIDSYSITDPFEEARAIELDERARAEARHAAQEAPDLIAALSRHAYDAIGFGGFELEDGVTLDANDPALAGAPAELLDDAVIFGASPRAVRDVTVAGKQIVVDGAHAIEEEARRGFEAALARIAR